MFTLQGQLKMEGANTVIAPVALAIVLPVTLPTVPAGVPGLLNLNLLGQGLSAHLTSGRLTAQAAEVAESWLQQNRGSEDYQKNIVPITWQRKAKPQ